MRFMPLSALLVATLFSFSLGACTNSYTAPASTTPGGGGADGGNPSTPDAGAMTISAPATRPPNLLRR